MKYSFVIPTYNNQALLKNVLEALNYQTGYGADDYEVLVVDDGSTDHTGEAIRGINHNYALQYWYLERGVDSCRSRTRNVGWQKARGEIVVFIDSDILVGNDYLAELDRCFAVQRQMAVLGNRLMLERAITREDVVSGVVFQDNRVTPERLMLLEYRHLLYEMTSWNVNAIMFPWMQFYSCNVAVPREWLVKVGGFDEHFKSWGMEDLELGYALFQAQVPLVVNSKLEALHQYHGERNDLVIRFENLAGYEQNIDYFLQKHPQAIKLPRKYALQCLKGEIPDDKFKINLGYTHQELDFKDRADLDSIKARIIQAMSLENTIVAICDYVEETDLDIWIQLLGNAGRMIQYYPMSKRIGPEAAVRFLKAEKKRQKQ